MASLEKRNDSYRIVFRFGGQKFSRSLKTNDETSAALSLARLEDNLRRFELGTLTVEPEDDIASVLLSSGRINKRPTAARTETIESLLDQHLANIPEGSIEASTRTMLAIHVRHLKRLLGKRTPTTKIDLSDLQAYVNKRSKEPGLRGRTVGSVTIRKELTTLQAAWNWATEAQLVSNKLPNKNRLRYPKSDEKPTFKTWAEIERIIARGNLTNERKADYWDCVYLTKAEIVDLLDEASSCEPARFLSPMLTFAAHTGARRSELLRCQMEDIDMESGHLIIREKKRVRGVRSTRSVPISPTLHRSLEAWFTRHPGGPFVFTLDGNELTRDQAHDYFKRTFANTKWDVLRGWHVLRHSFISNCASAGVDQRMIDNWVGHTSEAMRRRYRHLFPNTQKEALATVFE